MQRILSQLLGYIEFLFAADIAVSDVLGYIEYEGDAPPNPTADIHTVSDVLGYVEFTQPADIYVSEAFGYVEFISPLSIEATDVLGYVEYEGDAPANPTADIHTVSDVFAYLEYTDGDTAAAPEPSTAAFGPLIQWM